MQHSKRLLGRMQLVAGKAQAVEADAEAAVGQHPAKLRKGRDQPAIVVIVLHRVVTAVAIAGHVGRIGEHRGGAVGTAGRQEVEPILDFP